MADIELQPPAEEWADQYGIRQVAEGAEDWEGKHPLAPDLADQMERWAIENSQLHREGNYGL